MNKHAYMIFLLFIISACTVPVFGVETCSIKNGNINFTKAIELNAYKREYIDSSWGNGEDGKEEKGIYPIYSMLMYNGEIHAWAFASEYTSVSLKATETPNRFLVDDVWQLRGVGGGVRESIKSTLQKYSDKNTKYYVELDNNIKCSTSLDLIIGIYKDNVKVENIHFKIKEMDPKEVADRIKYHMQ